ncbi:MAG: metallophosphoesterase, partial [Alphaproteobacteria bacterium]|nr:metallophosphoesterase [Alphaproteobacteria bacterium]
MIRLVHISDIHLGPLPPVSPLALLNKRITGYANWILRRRDGMGRRTVDEIVRHLRACEPDLIAVTGDLTNLGLDAEFVQTRQWLRALGPWPAVAAIPGNHDAYVPGACMRAVRGWGKYGTGHRVNGAPFPFIRHKENVALIGCSSAVATPPFVAAGNFDAPQAERLETVLQALGEAGVFRVVMIHHPPTPERFSRLRGLWGGERFRAAIYRAGAELVLHGHEHESLVSAIQGPEGEVPVIGVAAAASAPGSGHAPARYNLFHIEKKRHGFSCLMEEFGYRRLGDT